MTTPRFSLLALVLSLALAACGSTKGDDNPPGDDSGDDSSGDDSSGDDSPNNPDARTNPGTPDAQGACANLAGTWVISGGCGSDVCTITQSGCAITQVSCTSGSHSETGSITGNNFSYTGVSGEDIPSTCSGTAAGGGISGTCTVGPGSCPFTGEHP